MAERLRGGQDRVQAGGQGEAVLEERAEVAGTYDRKADGVYLIMR